MLEILLRSRKTQAHHIHPSLLVSARTPCFSLSIYGNSCFSPHKLLSSLSARPITITLHNNHTTITHSSKNKTSVCFDSPPNCGFLYCKKELKTFPSIPTLPYMSLVLLKPLFFVHIFDISSVKRYATCKIVSDCEALSQPQG